MAVSDKRIVLGVTGGVAAYKSAELVRLLSQAGVAVQVVLTEAAARFVAPATFQALSGNAVYTDLWDPRIGNGMAHIELTRGAGGVLVAPASADFLAKLARGAADDLLSTLCLARDCPLLVAPAMNRQMWDNPATRRNIELLRQDGVNILGPAEGDQACGETGMGRMLEPEDLAEAAEALFVPRLLAGRRVVVTAGPTFEAFDPVRGITNPSSGRMGYAVARAAREAGAQVKLVSGPVALRPPFGVELERVTSARDMLQAVLAAMPGTDVFVAVAAVADYRPAEPSAQKMKRSGAALTLRLEPNPDILGTVAALPDAPFCVGFAAESEKLLEHARAKRAAKRVPLLAANLVQESLGQDEAALTLLDDDGAHTLPRAPKLQLARALVAHIAARLGTSRPAAGKRGRKR